jgi:hypothetical protein
MRPSRVEEVGGAVLAALTAGESVAHAAAAAGLPEQTLRSWIRRGRRDPQSRFGAIAAAVDRGRRPKLVAVSGGREDAIPTRAELLSLLGVAARRGHVGSAVALLRELKEAPGNDLTAEQQATSRWVMSLAEEPSDE